MSGIRYNFICVNVGPKYPMSYVEILRDMVFRNASGLGGDCAFWCVTDRPDELPPGVYPIPAKADLPGWWQKVYLFSADMPWSEGDRCVYLDLDVCITGRLEDLVDRKGIAHDPAWPCHNSSVMVWDHGEHREVWERFSPEIMTRAPGPIVPAEVLPRGVPNGGDQEWLSEVGGWEEFPADWVVSYRWQAKTWPPAGSRVVQFHGATKPADVTDGWVPNVWKVGGFTSLPVMTGSNVTPDFIRENVVANLARPYREPHEQWRPGTVAWFSGFGRLGPGDDEIVIVCGGPSMAYRLNDIRRRQRRGARVVTVNNALRFLLARGIKPDAHVMLDARAENAAFLENAPKDVRYLLATQCHPAVFDALSEHEVVMWHNFNGEDLRALLDPFMETRPVVIVPGGGTVGLRTMNLAWLSGFRTLHVYGLDGSFEGNKHHAYAQSLNDEDRVLDVQHGGRSYKCAPWMVRQAEEFREAYGFLRTQGVNVELHGFGLIPDIWKSMRNERAAA